MRPKKTVIISRIILKHSFQLQKLRKLDAFEVDDLKSENISNGLIISNATLYIYSLRCSRVRLQNGKYKKHIRHQRYSIPLN